MNYYCERKLDLEPHTQVEMLADSSIFIVEGGDGTMLSAVQTLVRNECLEIPLLGLNTGHVGFLSNDASAFGTSMVDFLSLLDEYKDMPYISERKLISLSKKDHFHAFALNDISIHPAKVGRLFGITLSITGNTITYKGDGVVIASSSGSTAYNLSAGGPIIHPDVDAVCITPLAPFGLASRSLVIPKETVFFITEVSKDAVVAVDGMFLPNLALKGAMISDTGHTVKLLKLTEYLEDVQNKLGWNANIKG